MTKTNKKLFDELYNKRYIYTKEEKERFLKHRNLKRNIKGKNLSQGVSVAYSKGTPYYRSQINGKYINGIQYKECKWFSINKYGDKEALRLAYEHRKQLEVKYWGEDGKKIFKGDL